MNGIYKQVAPVAGHMSFEDIEGDRFSAGDEIVYATRRGNDTFLQIGQIESITEAGHLVVRRTKDNRTVTLTNPLALILV